jgi:Protein of unknown function (DUF3017)
VNPGAGLPVRLAAAPAPSVPPGYTESGSWRGFWNQVGPPEPGTGTGDDSDDDLTDLPGSTGLTEPMPMISPGLPAAPPAVPVARPRPAQPPPPRPAPPPRPVTPASAPPWADAQTAPPAPAPPAPPAAPPAAPTAPPAPASSEASPEPAPARPAGSRRPQNRHGRDRSGGSTARWGAAYPIVLAGAAAGLAYLWRGPQNVRGGVLAVAVTLLLAAAARLVLPERRAGLLASRRRFADVAAFSILGLALLVAGLVLPAQG